MVEKVPKMFFLLALFLALFWALFWALLLAGTILALFLALPITSQPERTTPQHARSTVGVPPA